MKLFEAFKKSWLIITRITLVATLIVAAVSFFIIKPEYDVSTKGFIGKNEGENQAYSQNDVFIYQKPISPNKKVNIIIALLLGLMVISSELYKRK